MAELLADFEGPVFYMKDQDKILINRWVAVLLSKGNQSMTFSELEKELLYERAYTIHTKYKNGYITPSDFRKIAEMQDSPSEKSLTSALLKEWVTSNKIQKIKRGSYRFIEKSTIQSHEELIKEIVQKLSPPQPS